MLDSTGSRCRYASAKCQIQPNIWQKPRLAPWKPAHLHAPRRGSLKGPQTCCGDSRLNGEGRSSAGARLPPNELTLLPRGLAKVKGRSKQSNREGHFILYLIHGHLHLLHSGTHHDPPVMARQADRPGWGFRGLCSVTCSTGRYFELTTSSTAGPLERVPAEALPASAEAQGVLCLCHRISGFQLLCALCHPRGAE